MTDHSVYANSSDPPGRPDGRGAQVGAGANFDDALQPGAVLNEDFEIRGCLGSGGFGIVYEAYDRNLKSVVAIKEYFPKESCRRQSGMRVTVPNKDSALHAEGLAAFMAEGTLLRSLEDENIVRVYHCFPANGTAYLVMKRLYGRTLQEIIESAEQAKPRLAGQRRPDASNPSQTTDADDADEPSPDIVQAWTRTILGALEKVHSHGFLHRDISPSNIFIVTGGKPVLIDFGAARACVGRVSHRMTAISRPGYTPVEQYDDNGWYEQTPATDVYALGATLYHLVTGNRPLGSPARMTQPAKMRPASQLVGDKYPDLFLQSIDKAMKIQPTERWKSASDWLAELDGKKKATNPLKPRRALWKRPLFWISILALAVIWLFTCQWILFLLGVESCPVCLAS